MPYKSGENFCKMAEQPGKVIKKTNNVLTVRYKDGTEEGLIIGDIYTTYEGIDYKNTLTTTLKEGDSFKVGDNLYYHQDFFEPDWLNKRRILFKMSKVYTTALVSNAETYEDSSAISSRVSSEVKTNIVKRRSFILSFDTNISKIVSVGDEVFPNDSLFIDTGDGTGAGNLNSTSLSLLETLTAISPRAKYRGVIDRIEVKYNGEISDMSPTLAKIVEKLDRELYNSTKGTKKEARNNRVTGEYTTNGSKLDIDTLEISFCISTEIDMAIGDKLVIANQAKSVVGDVFNYQMSGAVSNDIVDVQTATIGFINRVIESPFRIGTTNRLTRHVSKMAADIYFGD